MRIMSLGDDTMIATVPALLAALRQIGQHQRVFQWRNLYLTSFTGQKVTADAVRDALDAGSIVKAASPVGLASWTLKPRGRPRKL